MAHMYNQIKGFNFYNIEANRCPIPDTLCCETVEFNLSGTKYPTLWQVAYDYNTHWYGGLSCILEGSSQEESKIITDGEKAKKSVKALSITVNRELGQIKQRVSDTEGNVSEIIQDAQGLTGIFKSAEGAKYIQGNVDGITIESDVEGGTKLNMDNDGVFIQDSNGNDVTSMQKDKFKTSEWVMTQTSDNTVFNIYREWE